MQKIIENESFTFECDGRDLAKVLTYYGYIPDVIQMNQKIVCPFHEDVNPSLLVDFKTGTWFCYGCAKAGDAFDFVKYINKDKNDLQACLAFLKILKSEKVEKIDLYGRIKSKKKQGKEAYDISYDYYYGLSKVDWKNDTSEEVVKAKDYMKKRGFSERTLNLCKAKVTYNKNYPIVFPMFDNGKFKGWVCRTMDKEVEKKRKYLYNTGFSRANTLVGDYEGYKIVYVVEGYMDRLRYIQNGIENVVAILGWKMSAEQEKKLKDAGVKIIISALDNDDCGKKGTTYLKTKFKNVVRFSYLKGIKDSGEMTDSQFKKMNKKTISKIAQDRRKR